MKHYLIKHSETEELRLFKSIYNYRSGEIVHPLDMSGRVVRYNNDWIVLFQIAENQLKEVLENE